MSEAHPWDGWPRAEGRMRTGHQLGDRCGAHRHPRALCSPRCGVSPAGVSPAAPPGAPLGRRGVHFTRDRRNRRRQGPPLGLGPRRQREPVGTEPPPFLRRAALPDKPSRLNSQAPAGPVPWGPRGRARGQAGGARGGEWRPELPPSADPAPQHCAAPWDPHRGGRRAPPGPAGWGPGPGR